MSGGPLNEGTADTAGLVECPRCRESISGNATVCPRCRTSTLVDLLVEQAVSDAKLRYRAARLVSSLKPGSSLSSLQAALSVSGGRVLSATAPGIAGRCAEGLDTLGVRTEQVVAEAESTERGIGWMSPGRLGIAAAATMVLAAVMFWPKGQKSKTEPSAAGEPKIGRRAKAAQAASGKQPLSGAQLAQRGLASTVVIRCDESLGSGFFVANDRILTNAHVVCPENETLHIRSSDGRQGTGKTLRVSQELDLALIQAEGLQGVALPLGDAGALQVGDPVVVVGAPKGMEFSVTQGGVSNLDRVSLGVAYLQTDAAINPGNSGGPMLDQQGRVVGVVSMKRTDAEGISLALPINYAFTGADAMLAFSLPEGSPGFERMLAAAVASDKQEVASLAATGQRPGLIGAEVAGSFIKATILWPSTFDPRQQRFRFVLWHKRDRLCSIDGDVATWRKVEGEEGKSPLPPQGRLWLERNGFSSNLFATATLLNYSTCPLGSLSPGSPVDLEMEGADSDASRVRL